MANQPANATRHRWCQQSLRSISSISSSAPTATGNNRHRSWKHHTRKWDTLLRISHAVQSPANLSDWFGLARSWNSSHPSQSDTSRRPSNCATATNRLRSMNSRQRDEDRIRFLLRHRRILYDGDQRRRHTRHCQRNCSQIVRHHPRARRTNSHRQCWKRQSMPRRLRYRGHLRDFQTLLPFTTRSDFLRNSSGQLLPNHIHLSKRKM